MTLLARPTFRRKFNLTLPDSFSGDVVSPNSFINMAQFPVNTVYQSFMQYNAYDEAGSGTNAFVMSEYDQHGIWNGTQVTNFGAGGFKTANSGPSPVTSTYGVVSDPEALGLQINNPLAGVQIFTCYISVGISLPGDFQIPIGVGGCFLAGTLIGTTNGYVAIESLKIGDKVYSYDTETKEIVHSEVTKLDERPSIGHFEVVIGKEKLLVTGEHPFYVPELDLFVSVRQLGIGVKVKQFDGPDLPITKITYIKKAPPVYNLSVDNMHNYFVGNRGLLVHNK